MKFAEEHPWVCAGVVLALFVAFAAGEKYGFTLGRDAACHHGELYCATVGRVELEFE
jgi:hypothetical protein